jgi:hypothetical protein
MHVFASRCHTAPCFAAHAAGQEHILNKVILKNPEFAIVETLLKREKNTLHAPFGNPFACKAAFQILNNDALRIPFHVMGFNRTLRIFQDGNEESMP